MTARAINIIRWTVGIFDGIIAVGLMLSAYAGLFTPGAFPVAAVLGLSFPLWLIGALIMMVISWFVWWRLGVFATVAILVCMGPILDFCPLNFGTRTLAPEEQKRAFTLLSYNTFGFYDQDSIYAGGVNHTFSHIINSNADIVCLSEGTAVMASDKRCVTQAQIDSLYSIYPYKFVQRYGQSFFSKYPAEMIDFDVVKMSNLGARLGIYRVDIKGHKVTIFNVHLQSYQLTKNDRDYAKSLGIRGKDRGASTSEVLIDKVEAASVARAEQARYLVKLVQRYGGQDVIVCGDFNDVPGCYTLRLLRNELGLHEVYPQVGFGPMITFNRPPFWFRIDHVMYRGNLEPVSMVKNTIRTSDHYPLLTTFLFDK